VKTDVDDEEIAPFMDDINRYFEYIDKEEIIKKIVSLEFGKFLAYYADAPEIEKVEAKKKTERGDRRDDKGKRREDRGQNDRQKRMNKPEPGFHRLFINLGKRDGFYPGELMKTLNRYVGGRQEVGHIDLLDTISYFEVPEKDARKVMTQLSGIRFHGRIVRCNSEDDDNKPEKREARQPRESRRGERGEKGERSERGERNERGERRDGEQRSRGGKHDDFVPQKGKNDWRDLMRIATEDNKRGRGKRELIGEEPDFSEEGWARRKPKKKK
jgi:ATP-dependent RNA helicase DeaD